MKGIKAKNSSKVLDRVATLSGIMKQMEEVKEQISIKYEQMV